MNTKTYDLCLPYFKQGDDLGQCLQEYPGDPAAALLAHAAILDNAAKTLRRIADAAMEHGLEIVQADTHFIRVECPSEIGDALAKENLLHEEIEDAGEHNAAS